MRKESKQENRFISFLKSPLKSFFILLIRSYQLVISPLLGPNCRFYPTCSAYAIQALSIHGCIKGIFLISIRLLKCHPFHPGGYDPVPKKGWGCRCGKWFRKNSS